MSKTWKIVTVCGSGVGSSMMMRLFSQQILDAEGIDATVDAADISSVDPTGYDLIITTSDFADAMRAGSTPVLRIDNMLDKANLKEQLLSTLNGLGG